MSSEAYRAGYNRGSADKIAGRKKSRNIDVKFQGAVDEYWRGYKKGYSKADRVGAIDYTYADAVIDKAKKRVDAEIPPRDPAYLFKIAKSAFNSSISDPRLDVESSKYVATAIGPYFHGKLAMYGVPSDKLAEISFMEIGARNASEVEDRKAQIAADAAAPSGIQIPGVSDAPPPSPSPFLIKKKVFGGLSSILAKDAEARAKAKADAEAKAKADAEAKAKADAEAKAKADAEAMAFNPPPAYDVRSLDVPIATQPAVSTETTKKEEKPSWVSQNWWVLALGGVVVAGAGGYFYYRSQRNV